MDMIEYGIVVIINIFGKKIGVKPTKLKKGKLVSPFFIIISYLNAVLIKCQ